MTLISFFLVLYVSVYILFNPINSSPVSGTSEDLSIYRNSPNFRLINGSRVSPEKFPYATYIYDDPKRIYTSCTGSLIASNIVLTAAHCFVDDFGKLKPVNFYVSVGSIYSANNNTNRYNVLKKIPHPKFDSVSRKYDVGILVLDGDTNIDPSKFAKIYDKEIKDFFTVETAGWGLTSVVGNIATSEVLLSVPIILSSSESCKKYNPEYNGNNGFSICTITQNSQGSCFGDSGAPLAYTQIPSYPIIGITSYGEVDPDPITGQKQVPCGVNGGYGYYTNAYYYINWISTASNIPRSELVYSKPQLKCGIKSGIP
ncbi:Chymotrypsin-2 [Smittium culicis]|uniref:Chymotrypsin-2 n=1 Tax=Smittium culicis TaxID=133412 RepID=A0A1R1XDS6_9FUNG|nr:Chymotrypsin-2 [Smittium culicis]